jgi:alkanesulfonate monooxygenase SsuD/methylene tetrahydromethanopterin reductase-like flavin-dependent oxidoreductase (luciferase family)
MPFLTPFLPLSVEIHGYGSHPASWRSGRQTSVRPTGVRGVAQIAERAGVALVTTVDDVLPPDGGAAGRIGAVERAAFIAGSATVLSAAPVISTTHTEPFQVSRQLASIDHITAGRTGWVVGTSPQGEGCTRRDHFSLAITVDSRSDRPGEARLGSV